MEVVYFYAPEYMGTGKRVEGLLREMDADLKKSMFEEAEDVFCIPSSLTQPLPVGSVIKFFIDNKQNVVQFKVTEIFTVEGTSEQPDVVFLELQLSHYDEEVTATNLLSFLKKKNAQEKYHFW